MSRLADLREEGRSDRESSRHLYAVRNALAHGKREFLRNDFGSAVVAVAQDLPIVKLLARMVVEGLEGLAGPARHVE